MCDLKLPYIYLIFLERDWKCGERRFIIYILIVTAGGRNGKL